MQIKNFILFLFFIGSLHAQESSVSPFSSQGLGDVGYYGSAYFMGLGGSSVALADSSQANLYNPSTYSFLSQGLPLFSMGIAHQESEFSQNDLSARSRYSSISHMSLIVPFGKRFGLAFGLKPLSRTGYEINSAEVINNDSIFYDYTGKGEIQEFLLGFSMKLVDKMNHKLSVGANGIRYFGRIENEKRAYQKSNFIEVGAFEQNFLQAGAFGYELGATYKFSPSSKHVLTLGGYYRLNQDLSMSRSNTRVRFGEFGNKLSYDTLVPLTRREGYVSLPEKLNVGFAYEFKAQKDSESSSGRSPSFMITGEYSTEAWGQYSEHFNDVTTEYNFFDSYSIRTGIQYIPHKEVFERSSFVKGYQKWSYRVGAYAVSEPYVSGGEQVSDMGVSFGVGIPIALNMALSSINFSVNYGERGARSGSGQLQEKYVGVNFGLNIAPSYDRWFRKYKLN